MMETAPITKMEVVTSPDMNVVRWGSLAETACTDLSPIKPVDPIDFLPFDQRLTAIEARLATIEASRPSRREARPGPSISIQLCAEIVAARHGLRLLDLLAKRRARDVVRPRQIAIWLATRVTAKSLPQIGAFFDLDHTTVMHARDAIDRLRAEDGGIDFDTRELLRLFGVGQASVETATVEAGA
jgi:hypothetical protein